ncbi:MAG: hypothetical protein EBZ48_03130 [Proteobacteria bacterium]|nr:hypothetical protein [Pseudomonadota bacterium]
MRTLKGVRDAQLSNGFSFGCMPHAELKRSVIALATAFFVLVLALIPSSERTRQQCQIYSRTEGDTFYLDPAYNTRFRIKGNEVAVRLEGAFDTNQSAYKNLAVGEAVYFKAIRKIPAEGKATLSDHTVMEVIAANVGGKIKWTLGYQGDSQAAQNKALLASNVDGSGAFDCQIIRKRPSDKLNLKELRLPGVQYGPDQIVEIPANSVVYSKLGL